MSGDAGGAATGAPATPPLVVRTDRPAIDRLFRRIVSVQVVALLAEMTIVALALTVTSVAWLAVPLGILLLSTVLQIGAQCYAWGARVGVGVPLVVSAEGLVFDTAQGQVRLAWPCVDALSERRPLGRPVLTFHVVAGLAPDGPGVVSELSPKQWARLGRRGLPLGSVGVTPGLDVVEQAVAHFSGGRLAIPGHWAAPG